VNRRDKQQHSITVNRKHCGVPVGEVIDHWGGKHGWIHRLEDGPDAYIFCRDEEGNEADPGMPVDSEAFNKWWGSDHHAKTGRCPRGKKSRIGYIGFAETRFQLKPEIEKDSTHADRVKS